MRLLIKEVFAFVLTCATLGAGAKGQTSAKDQTVLASTKQAPDIATFMQIGGSTPAGYSWDGKGIYFTSSMSGASQAYRLTVTGWPYQLSMFPDGIDFFTLSYGGDMAVVGASTGGSEQSQLYLMDTESGRTAQLTNAEKVQFGTVFWAKDDLFIYYRSNQENSRDFFIYKMNLASGASVKVFGDSTGVKGSNAVAGLSQDGSRMIIANYRSNVANDLYLLNLADGKYQKLNDDSGNVIYESPTLMPDNRTIWLLCNNNADGTTRVAKMKVGSAAVEFLSDGWIDPKWEVENLVFSRDYRFMSATFNQDGYIRLKLREVESGAELPTPPLDGMLGSPIFDDSGSCLIPFNSPSRAPDVWRWNPFSRGLTQLTFASYAGIDRGLFSDPKLVTYRSFDSLIIPAFVYLPKNYEKGKAIPFIVDAHGGPEGQSRPYFSRNIQYLILHGFGVIQPNVRGSMGYGRTYLALDDYRNRKNSLKDYRAAVDFLLAEGYTKPGMIGIRGGSYGGYVVLGMITEYPDLFAAASNTVGIANFQTFLANTAPYRRAIREAEYGPMSDTAFLKEISPIHKANLIKTPLLVIHGENDPRVPIGEARQIIKAVRDNGGIVDSLIFPDEGHGASKKVNVIAEYRKQVEFFTKYLVHPEAAAPPQKSK
jgi:dipeptidyl aminopeptidase/acylaminoacyl peptidase